MADLTKEEILQELEVPSKIELFEVTYLGETYRFTNSLRESQVWWNNNRYYPFPVSLTGVGFTEDNNSTKPRLTLSVLGIQGAEAGLTLSLIPNLKGASLTYIVNFENFIRTSSTGNVGVFFTKSHYKFANTITKTTQQIVYELDGLLSFTSKRMFGRQILREGYTNLKFEGAGLSKHI